MIQEVTMYRVRCDTETCDESPQDGDYYAWSQRDVAIQDAVDAGWYVTDKSALCTDHAPICAELDCGVHLANDACGTHCEYHAIPPTQHKIWRIPQVRGGCQVDLLDCPPCRGTGVLRQISLTYLLVSEHLPEVSQPWETTPCPICGGAGVFVQQATT